jgi:hypothetical protein
MTHGSYYLNLMGHDQFILKTKLEENEFTRVYHIEKRQVIGETFVSSVSICMSIYIYIYI